MRIDMRFGSHCRDAHKNTGAVWGRGAPVAGGVGGRGSGPSGSDWPAASGSTSSAGSTNPSSTSTSRWPNRQGVTGCTTGAPGHVGSHRRNYDRHSAEPGRFLLGVLPVTLVNILIATGVLLVAIMGAMSRL